MPKKINKNRKIRREKERKKRKKVEQKIGKNQAKMSPVLHVMA